MITAAEKTAILLEMHRAIETAATEAAAAISEHAEFELFYPPNGGFSTAEEAALAAVVGSPLLTSALRKVVANAAAAPLFHLFALFDGVADPHGLSELWLGAHIAPKSKNANDDTSDTTLHDDFFESYWQWRQERPSPGWRLDNWSGE